MKKPVNIILLLSVAILLAGCMPVISRSTLQGVNRDLTFELVRERPSSFVGEKVLWGGVILSTNVRGNKTFIEVIQTPLDFTDRPKDIDQSKGRFIVEAEGFLDPAVYKKGREITVAGEIVGIRKRELDKTEYRYIVIRAIETHLWKKVKPIPPSPYPPYYYDPFYSPYYPYPSPYYPYPPGYIIPPDWNPPNSRYPYWHPSEWDK